MLAVRLAVPMFFAAMAVDLLTKQWAVGHAPVVVYNNKPSELPMRVLMSLVAIAVAYALAQVAMQRGLGRQWGVWLGCGLLVAGVLSNGISPFLWSRGVPDFLGAGDGWFWNLADLEIAAGLVGGIGSVAVCAVVIYGRERLSASGRS